MGLSEEFYRLLSESESDPQAEKKAAELVLGAPEDAESRGLLALMYHDEIGVDRDLDKAFEYAEEAAAEDEGVALYLLGFMCDNSETPDQFEGGPRQKYDHYDAEQFMERCAATSSSWAVDANLWLGRYFMDMARGGDPEYAVDCLERIGEVDDEAAGMLSDYYWNLLDIDYAHSDEEKADLERKVLKWTEAAARMNARDYSFRLGCCFLEGIGCDGGPDFTKARKYLEEAYELADPRAAEALVYLFGKILEEKDPDAPEYERQNCQRLIDYWKEIEKRQQDPDNIEGWRTPVEED